MRERDVLRGLIRQGCSLWDGLRKRGGCEVELLLESELLCAIKLN